MLEYFKAPSFLDSKGEMMKYTIEENKAGVDIYISDVKNEKQKFLEAIRACQEGSCFCPTNEYTKLASIGVVKAIDRLELHLKARNGKVIDQAEIAKCMDYMVEKVASVRD